MARKVKSHGDETITLAVAAELLNVNRRSVWRYATVGFKGVKLATVKADGSKALLTSRDAIAAFQEQAKLAIACKSSEAKAELARKVREMSNV